MSMFKVPLVVVNPKQEELTTQGLLAIVDTGSELTWFPKEELIHIGIQPKSRKRFVSADGTILERDVGYAIIRAEGFEPSMKLFLRKKAI